MDGRVLMLMPMLVLLMLILLLVMMLVLIDANIYKNCCSSMIGGPLVTPDAVHAVVIFAAVDTCGV